MLAEHQAEVRACRCFAGSERQEQSIVVTERTPFGDPPSTSEFAFWLADHAGKTESIESRTRPATVHAHCSLRRCACRDLRVSAPWPAGRKIRRSRLPRLRALQSGVACLAPSATFR